MPAASDALRRELAALTREADEPLRAAIAAFRGELTAARVAADARDAFRRLPVGAGRVRLHLGCGPDLRAGWVNIDLVTREPVPPSRLTDPVFINHDLRRGLPLPDGSCSMVYSSHFLEHLEYRHALALMRECLRCLEPGGVFRAAVPDLRADFAAYVARDSSANEEFDEMLGADRVELVRGLPAELRGRAMADYLNYAVHQYGEHRTIWDEENLRLALEWVGFATAAESGYRAGIDVDDPARRAYSLYVEAAR